MVLKAGVGEFGRPSSLWSARSMTRSRITGQAKARTSELVMMTEWATARSCSLRPVLAGRGSGRGAVLYRA